MNFNVIAEVARIQRSDSDPEIIAFHADFKVQCRECGLPFEFVGLPLGFSHYRPTVAIDGTILHQPLIPQGGKVTEGLAGFNVTMQSFPSKEPTKQ